MLLVAFALVVAGQAADPCDPACVDANTLSFCDGDAPTTLTCSDVADGSICATLSEAWGPDCVLPQNAPCDVGYAFGASRCDAGAGLSCIDGTCEPGAPVAPTPLSPTSGTVPASTTTTTASDASCASSPGALVLMLSGMGLRRRRSSR